jgi:hypothetical protein
MKKVFQSHFKSSQIDELSSSSLHFIQLSLLILNFWTPSVNWKLSLPTTRLDLLQLRTFRGCFPLRTTSRGCLLPRTNWELTSVSPINPWSDTRKTTVLLLLHHCGNSWHHCWCSHLTPPHSCVIQVFIAAAWQWGTCLPRHCVSSVAGWHGPEDTTFLCCCVIAPFTEVLPEQICYSKSKERTWFTCCRDWHLMMLYRRVYLCLTRGK